MPYSVIKEDTLIDVRFSGTFNPKDNNDATVELYSQPDIYDIEFIIWDFSEVTEMNMTERDWRCSDRRQISLFNTSKYHHRIHH